MALCREFRPDNVGFRTGDATVNREAHLNSLEAPDGGAWTLRAREHNRQMRRLVRSQILA